MTQQNINKISRRIRRMDCGHANIVMDMLQYQNRSLTITKKMFIFPIGKNSNVSIVRNDIIAGDFLFIVPKF